MTMETMGNAAHRTEAPSPEQKGNGEKSRIAQLAGVLKSPKFYVGLCVLFLGIQLTLISQRYLYESNAEGQALPVLSDIILDNLPYWDIGFLYDLFDLAALLVFAVYAFHRRRFALIPYYLLLCGIFHLVRGAFIVLTPFGNPPGFDGTEGWFNGFSNFEAGVYPSGHAGISFLYYLLTSDRRYRAIVLACVAIVIFALFLSRGHYSIDVLSGIFFAYAIKAFGDKHILKSALI